MKKLIQFLMLVLIVLQFSCGNDDSTQSTSMNSEGSSPVKTSDGDGVVGEWQQVNTIFDQNENYVLDDVERKNPSPNKIGDYYLRFYPGKKCKYGELEFEGSYELKTQKEHKYIHIEGGDPRNYRILSLDKNEMVLMPSGAPGTFLVYKRV